MAKRSGKGIVGISVAVLLIAICTALIIGLFAIVDKGTSFEPSPNSGGFIPKEDLGNEESCVPDIDWGYWLKINPQIIGWIYAPDTPISYPVVQAPKENPTFYLNHDVYDDYNLTGAIYLDSECDGLFDKDNSVIFGHSFYGDDSLMFGPLQSFVDDQYALEHLEFYVLTPIKDYRCQVFSVQVIPGSNPGKILEFDSDELFISYKKQCVERSEVNCIDGEEFDASPIITLVTCSYFVNPDNERIVISLFVE